MVIYSNNDLASYVAILKDKNISKIIKLQITCLAGNMIHHMLSFVIFDTLKGNFLSPVHTIIFRDKLNTLL